MFRRKGIQCRRPDNLGRCNFTLQSCSDQPALKLAVRISPAYFWRQTHYDSASKPFPEKSHIPQSWGGTEASKPSGNRSVTRKPLLASLVSRPSVTVRPRTITLFQGGLDQL